MSSDGLWAVLLAFGLPLIAGLFLIALALYMLIKKRSFRRNSLRPLITGAVIALVMGILLLIVVMFESIPVRLFGVPSYAVGGWNDRFAFSWTLAAIAVSASVAWLTKKS